MNKGVKLVSAGADSGTSTKHSNLGDGTQRFNLGFGYLGKERGVVRGSSPSPSFPKPKSHLFPKNNLLTLSRSRDELARPISRRLSWQGQSEEYLALWDTFWNMFLFWNCTNLLAATPFPAVLLLARTLGTINPVRRAWVYGH